MSLDLLKNRLNAPHLVCVHNLHHALLEELGVNLAGDGRRLLHQAQLAVLLHRHRVGHHGADVHLQGANMMFEDKSWKTRDVHVSTMSLTDASHLLQTLGGDGVVPALHVLPGELVLAEDAHRLPFSAASDRLDHLIEVGFVALILLDVGAGYVKNITKTNITKTTNNLFSCDINPKHVLYMVEYVGRPQCNTTDNATQHLQFKSSSLTFNKARLCLLIKTK